VSAGRAGHREIDHTADLGFEVWAPDRQGLFAEASLALCELCFDRQAVQGRERRRIEAEAGSDEELLIRWLQEIYLQLEIDGWLTRGTERIVVDAGRVHGTLVGEPHEPGRHTVHTEIKAVTYHGLTVGRDDDGLWRATVIVDV
jgi:SHS2 domain-containing protein